MDFVKRMTKDEVELVLELSFLIGFTILPKVWSYDEDYRHTLSRE